MKEAPKQQDRAEELMGKVESIESFDDFKTAVMAVVELQKKLNVLDRRNFPLRDDEAILQEVRDVPEFAGLIQEERDILISGPSRGEIRKYGNLYERAYALRRSIVDEMNKHIGRVREQSKSFEIPGGGFSGTYLGYRITETAELMARIQPDDAAVQAILRDGFRNFELEKERQQKLEQEAELMPKLQEEHGPQFVELRDNLNKALEAERLRVQLESVIAYTQSKGFVSAGEMGEEASYRLQELEKKLGKDAMELLRKMNPSPRW